MPSFPTSNCSSGVYELKSASLQNGFEHWTLDIGLVFELPLSYVGKMSGDGRGGSHHRTD